MLTMLHQQESSSLGTVITHYNTTRSYDQKNESAATNTVSPSSGSKRLWFGWYGEVMLDEICGKFCSTAPTHRGQSEPAILITAHSSWMNFCLSCMASIQTWLHDVEAFLIMIWLVAKPWWLRFVADTQRPKWASNPNFSEFMMSEFLFGLHGIHTNMFCKRTIYWSWVMNTRSFGISTACTYMVLELELE